jgi:hypothetical protein
MYKVTITDRPYNHDKQTITNNVICVFTVDDSGITTIEQGDEYVPKTRKVLDFQAPLHNNVVTLESNPLRWAELLPESWQDGWDHMTTIQMLDQKVS